MTFGMPNQRVRSGELFRYPANTCQPSRWSRTTSASPIPVAAPVMKTDLIGEAYPRRTARIADPLGAGVMWTPTAIQGARCQDGRINEDRHQREAGALKHFFDT